MVDDIALHRRLVSLQPTDELKRKADKARTAKYWTQEEVDYARRLGNELHERLHHRWS